MESKPAWKPRGLSWARDSRKPQPFLASSQQRQGGLPILLESWAVWQPDTHPEPRTWDPKAAASWNLCYWSHCTPLQTQAAYFLTEMFWKLNVLRIFSSQDNLKWREERRNILFQHGTGPCFNRNISCKGLSASWSAQHLKIWEPPGSKTRNQEKNKQTSQPTKITSTTGVAKANLVFNNYCCGLGGFVNHTFCGSFILCAVVTSV